MNTNRIIIAKKEEFIKRGLIPPTQVRALPKNITSMRPSLAQIRKAGAFIKPTAIKESGLSLLFDVTLPNLMPELVDMKEKQADETLGLIFGHYEKALELPADRSPEKYIKTLSSELPHWKRQIALGMTGAVLDKFWQFHIEDKAVGIFALKGSDRFTVSMLPSGFCRIECTAAATDSDLKVLEHIMDLGELSISGCHAVTDNGISSISGSLSLDSVTIGPLYHVTLSTMSMLAALPALRTVALDRCWGADITWIKELLKSSSFTELVYEGKTIAADTLRPIIDDPRALLETDLAGRYVSLSESAYGGLKCELTGGSDMPASIIARIPEITEVKQFVREGCITDSGLECISRMSWLKSLELITNNFITEEGIAPISALRNLVKLNLDGVALLRNGSMRFIAELEGLKDLSIADCMMIDDQGIKHISVLQHVERLDLKNCGMITDDGLALFSHLRLKSLSLFACKKLTDASIRLIAEHFPDLEELDLSICEGINNGAPAEISKLKKLRTLALYRLPQVRDPWLEHFARLPELKELNLNSTSVTDESVAELKIALPGISITK